LEFIIEAVAIHNNFTGFDEEDETDELYLDSSVLGQAGALSEAETADRLRE
jgi:hypothetical protein